MADAVRGWLSLRWEMFQEFGVLPSFDPLLPVFPVFLMLFDVVSEPGSSRVLDVETLALECLHLLDFLSGWHGSLEVGIRMELVRLQVVPQNQRCPVDHFKRSTKILDSLDRVGGSIGDFKIDWCLQGLELITALRE